MERLSASGSLYGVAGMERTPSSVLAKEYRKLSFICVQSIWDIVRVVSQQYRRAASEE